MDEEYFELMVAEKSEQVAEEDLKDFAVKNRKLISAIMFLRETDSREEDLDDWECWIGKYIFKEG